MQKELISNPLFLLGRWKLTSGIFSVIEPKIRVDIDRAVWPNTANALYYSVKKIDWLLRSLMNLKPTEEESFYLMYILMRPIVERYFIAFYIATKARLERSDTAGRQFYNERFKSEYIKRIDYTLKFTNIIKNKSDKPDLLSELNRRHGKEVPQFYVDEIHTIGNQFELGKIIQYLVQVVRKDDFMSEFNFDFAELFRLYNQASSYLHGGILAEEEHFRLEGKEKSKQFRLESYATIGQVCSLQLKEMLFEILRLRNKEYKKIFIPLNQYNDFYERLF